MLVYEMVMWSSSRTSGVFSKYFSFLPYKNHTECDLRAYYTGFVILVKSFNDKDYLSVTLKVSSLKS